MTFSISEKYTLKLSWDAVSYNREGFCDLSNATLSGPALSIAHKIQPNEYINLDFYRQYYILVNNVYVGKFSWGEVVYNSNGTVTLKNASISHDKELNRVPKLSDRDFILIDTSRHEVSNHAFTLLYDSYVINESGVLYNFG